MRSSHPRMALTVVCLIAVFTAVASAQSAHQGSSNDYGVSGGNVNDRSNAFCCSGTLGALVKDSNNVQYILSNNHVLGRSGTAVAGEDVSQPGMIDANCQVREIVADFTVAPALEPSNVDAGIAQLRSGAMNSTGAILGVGTPSTTVRNATVGLPVIKAGRTTGVTTSTVGSVNTTVNVQYQQGCGKGKKFTVNYTNQVVINSSSFSAGGDSGSLILSNTSTSCRQPVALLYAGSSTTTIGNPIGEVLTRLGTALGGGRTVSFVGQSCTSTSAQASVSPQGELLPQVPASDVARAAVVKDRVAPGLMRDPAIMGVGVGAHAERPWEPTIVIYVEAGVRHGRLPRMVDGIETTIIRTDKIRAYGWNEKEGEPRSCSAK